MPKYKINFVDGSSKTVEADFWGHNGASVVEFFDGPTEDVAMNRTVCIVSTENVLYIDVEHLPTMKSVTRVQ